ncbi:type VI secretion system amidase immunity protein Tai4 [Paraburkholderia rhizosphaerae]|uniref:Type VI secretion system (T6SS) amidase immunity protein Tai4 n=1 Tax=Paraburkholderia rhizosphaerae TaxID=480658 RepID=A0A4R8LKC9_9BURK|nr:type VI secretion system amidase immunity protein Tai4 [Paraburkholderia rhizosphaerae]TDY43854.1 type VI secretion system (T6SS) amidase immunity protein Tai4 [Paraburkholderia rhizosphaerae]
MKKIGLRILAALALTLLPLVGSAADDRHSSPQAGTRTYAQNYKDMVLATCIANAYTNDKNAAIDAGSSVSALRDWTYYDLEKSPDAIKSLVDVYLARDYHNPLVESEMKGVRFDFLKCLDMYHSKELDVLTKRMVINPKRTYRQDNPPPAKPK